MTDFAADGPTSSGQSTTERSCALAGVDTVPAGCVIVARNSTANAHVLTLVDNYQHDGNATASKTISIGASPAVKLIRVPASYGDANGRVGFSSDVGAGAVTDTKYYVVGA
ncbi:MAG TPA: hypothetical protein VIV12_11760 [Streptosporangiaceae bacterium]